MSQLTLTQSVEVQYYDEWKGELTHSQRHKAEQFIDYDCIRYIGDKFVCLPLNTEAGIVWCGMRFDKKPFPTNYNTRTYLMVRDAEFGFMCNCQGFVSKEKRLRSGLSPNPPFCSHLLALMLAFKEKRFGGGR